MRKMTVRLGARSYDVCVRRGCLDSVGEWTAGGRHAFVLTDGGVPPEYAARVAEAAGGATVHTVAAGEGSKSFETLEKVCLAMQAADLTRGDCLIAVGGGVVGDLGGFAASVYMRGIAFYNCPTTLLSQVDSSVGGKTAVNLGGVKNAVGTFYQPAGVHIDPDVLETLPRRQFSAGMAEVIKMALTHDADLFTRLEEEVAEGDALDGIIFRAADIKRRVVEADEREAGLRRVLNFGHTFGHALESEGGLGTLLHGECVALGILPMCTPQIRKRLIPVYQKYGLPYRVPDNAEHALAYLARDKKRQGERLQVIFCDRIGSFRPEATTLSAYEKYLREEIKKMREEAENI